MRAKLAAFVVLVRMPFRISWWRPLAAAGMQASSQLAMVSFAFGLRVVVDGVTGHDRSRAYVGIAVLAASGLWNQGGSYVAFVLRHQMVERTTLALDSDLGRAATTIPGIEHFERHEYLDKLELLRQQHQTLAMLPDWVAQLTGAVVRLLATVAVLATIDARLLLLPVFSIPSIVGTLSLQKRLFRTWDRAANLWRLQFGLFRLGAEEPGGRELRVFGRAGHVQRLFSDSVEEANAIITTALWRASAIQTAGWAIFGAAFAAGLLLVGHDAVSHRVGPGEIVLAISLAGQMNTQMAGVANVIAGIGQGLQTAERFVWLVSESARHARGHRAVVPAPALLEQGIEMESVSFSYPGTEAPVLHDVNLSLPAGSTVALVGPNGAGKTTLVKLLSRMYEPTAGRITVDGVDLADIDPAEWRRRMSAGFQDHAHFEFVARQCVGIGELSSIDDDVAIGRGLIRAGAGDLVAGLPAGLDTQLGKLFDDGTELSGGQWQKLALARAMMRDQPLLMVLDEPTAALDAAAEEAIFQGYRSASRLGSQRVGAITLFVTHRLATVRMADLIVVVDHGGVAEVGRHDELVRRGGQYAELYRLQAASYS
ncbi:MAG TPA: ABC transporter ATP-binding protein [Acidimicrobiales bacterium]|nr:ABC transporter ATP-binding protein [Acidimicrobiales bacterium]